MLCEGGNGIHACYQQWVYAIYVPKGFEAKNKLNLFIEGPIQKNDECRP